MEHVTWRAGWPSLHWQLCDGWGTQPLPTLLHQASFCWSLWVSCKNKTMCFSLVILYMTALLLASLAPFTFKISNLKLFNWAIFFFFFKKHYKKCNKTKQRADLCSFICGPICLFTLRISFFSLNTSWSMRTYSTVFYMEFSRPIKTSFIQKVACLLIFAPTSSFCLLLLRRRRATPSPLLPQPHLSASYPWHQPAPHACHLPTAVCPSVKTLSCVFATTSVCPSFTWPVSPHILHLSEPPD